MSRVVNCLLVQANGNTSRVKVNVGDCLDMAKAIGCDYIEVATRHFNERPYLIVCDEEGKLKKNQITIVTSDYNGSVCECFVGDCLIMKGGFKSLSDSDIESVAGTVTSVMRMGNKGEFKVLLCSKGKVIL